MKYTTTVALIAAFGGFLMGFDASVISGVVGYIEVEFALSKIELGWAVSSLVLTATLGMLLSGPLSDRIGRRPVLRIAAVLFAVSAIIYAIAPTFTMLVFGRSLQQLPGVEAGTVRQRMDRGPEPGRMGLALDVRHGDPAGGLLFLCLARRTGKPALAGDARARPRGFGRTGASHRQGNGSE